MPEARLEDSDSGRYPASDGWFVVNVRDTVWLTSDTSGAFCPFEGRACWFPHVGFRISVLEPGKPNAVYHAESQQEAFLVLSGESPGSARSRPATARRPSGSRTVPRRRRRRRARCRRDCGRSPTAGGAAPPLRRAACTALAAPYDASVQEATSDPDKACARWEEPRLGRPPYWDRLSWA